MSQLAARRVWARIAAVITVLGWVLIAVAPAALVLGYTLGWQELVVVGWATTVLLLLAALYLVGGATLAVDLQLTHPRVVVGHTATAEMVVRHEGRAPLSASVVEVPVGERLIDVALPALRRGTRHVHEFDIPTSRRGVVTVGPARSVRADPIGLVRREQVWTGHTLLYVHPRTIALASMSTGLVRDLEGTPTRDLSTSDMSFHALREYQPGDERRSIHWKSTAKTGRYMVRQYEETRRSHLLIALSLAEADFANDSEFDLAIEVAASLGARAIRDTRDVSVIVSAAPAPFARRAAPTVAALATLTRARLLDDLTPLHRISTAASLTEVARVAADRVVGVSVAFVVCGSPVTAAQLRSTANEFGPGVEVVAILCDPDRVPGARRVAALTVITVGSLEDLQRSLARSVAL
jgi:uncharacterized protein (DUF58 family)